MKKILSIYRNINAILKYKIKIQNKASVGKNCFFEGGNLIGSNTVVRNVSMGYGSYIANDSKITNSIIGKYCSIGPEVITVLGTHPSHTFVSTHPAFYSIKEQSGFTYVKEQKFKERNFEFNGYSIEIGNDVWIGARVSIMEGVKIGDGAIVAAGAVITKDVPPYAIVAGIPAKILKYRFEGGDINFLNEFKWWEYNENWIKMNIDLFEDISIFKSKMEV